MKRTEYNTLIFSLLVSLSIVQVLASWIFKFSFSWPLYLSTILLMAFLFFVKIEIVATLFKVILEKLQKFNNTLFMGVVYFLILSPVGFIRRKVSGYKVRTSVKKEQSTYLQAPGVKSNDFTRPF